MLNRLLLLLIVLFWVTMNVLLWRSEFAGKNELGSGVPVETVWQKMLRAPDDSNLEIFHHGKKIGGLRWSPNVGEMLATGKTAAEELQPEGRIKNLGGYTIDVMDGTLEMPESRKRLRFNFSSSFTTNHAWQEFSVRVALRPSTWELRTVAAEETLHLKFQEGDDLFQRDYTFAELRDPEKLLREFAGPLPLGMLLGGLLPPGGGQVPALKNASLGLRWEARNDWMKIGHAQFRIHRLSARLLNRYQVVVCVSRVGEILRVDLPDGVRVMNTAFTLY